MTSATTEPARGTGGRRAEGRGYGLVLFSSVLLVIVGCFNLIYGIAAIANAHVFTANAHYVFGSMRTWGWITLIDALQLLAAAGVLARNQLARWFGVAVLGLSAIDQMFLHLRLPVLVPDDHRGGRGRLVWAVRLRQPCEPGRLAPRVAVRARMCKERWLCVISGQASRCGHRSGRRARISCMGTRSRAATAGGAAGQAGPPSPHR